jgi:hypothetical protein
MILILGFKKAKVVGLDKNKRPTVFGPDELDDYESPKTKSERDLCIKMAIDSYNLEVKNGSKNLVSDFALLPASKEVIKKLAEKPELLNTIYATLNVNDLATATKTCRYCGQAFIPRTSWQEVCEKAECQTARTREMNRAAWQRRKARLKKS